MSGETSGGVAHRFRLAADLVAQRGFVVVRRGYDQDEVRAFLAQVAAEVRDLHSQIEDLEAAADANANAAPVAPVERPPLDEETVVALVGEETANVLRAARTAAVDMRKRAQSEAERIVEDAQEASVSLRQEAEGTLATARNEAEATAEGLLGDARSEADALRRDALSEAEQLLHRARSEADAVREHAEQERRLTVDGAQAVREKILGDLSRRRRVATVQIEQLRAGRERLLESYSVVRRTLEEVHDELQRADSEARAAADDAGRRAESVPAESVPAESVPAESVPAGSVPAESVSDRSDTAAPGPDPTEHGPEGSGTSELEGEAPGSADDGSVSPGVGRGEVATVDPTVPPDVAPAPDDTEVAGVVISDDGIDRVRVLRPQGGAGAPELRPRADAGRTGAPTLRSLPGGRVAAGGGEPVEIVDSETILAPLEEARGAPGAPADLPTAEVDTKTAGGAGIEHLFARIRSGRDAEVEAARRLLDPATPAAPAASSGDTGRRPWPEGDTDDGLELRRSDEDESVLQRRDAALAEIEAGLTKKLKRALQDEQNELLDRLRGQRGAPRAAALLGDGADHAARVAGVATTLLDQARRAGTDFVAPPDPGVPTAGVPTAGVTAGGPEGGADVTDVADGLAATLVGPLRRRLTDAVAQCAGDEQPALVEAIGSVYREWKTQRVEPAVIDAVATAFAGGSFAAFPDATLLRWVVEDADGPCPDCDDNALSGYQPKGEAFPTGQLHPPAHAGCRCVLAPEGS